MEYKLKDFKKYLSQHPLVDGDSKISSVMEAICDFYMMTNGPENEEVKQILTELDARIQMLSFAEQDAVFSTVSRLGAQWERCAFLSGLRIGAQLALELLEKENCHCEPGCSQ